MKYGYFDDRRREYVITDPRTPTKWINYVGTLAFGGLVDHTGGSLICANDPGLNRIAAEHGKSPVQVTLRWLLQQPRVAAIPKAATPEHREANLDLFDFELGPAEMTAIHDLDRDQRLVDPAGGPAWERD